MWINVQLTDAAWRKTVCDKIGGVVQEMGGEVVEYGGLGDLVAVAKFSHRKYRTVEKAVAAALNTFPVMRTTVAGKDLFILHPKTLARTEALDERQDQLVG